MASNVSPLHFLFVGNGTSTTEAPLMSPLLVNETAVTQPEASISLATVIPMTLTYVVILIAGLVGNVCTCVVIARNKYMHTATNYYLFSLAVSDLLLLVLGLPHELFHLWSPEPYLFGELVCILRGLAAETSTNATILTITAFTVERYVAICHPLRSHTMSKLSRALKLVVAIWLVSCACAIPIAIQFGITYPGEPPDPARSACTVKTPFPHAFEISTFIFFCLPMTIISVLYLRIGAKLRQSSNTNSGQCTPSCTKALVEPDVTSEVLTQQQQQQQLRQQQQQQQIQQAARFRSARQVTASSRRAVIKMLVAVVVAFFICWAPFHAQRLIAVYASQPPSDAFIAVYNVITYLSGVLYYVSATINPILYHIMSLKFRLAFRDTLSRCCGGRRGHRSGKCHSLSHFPSTFRSRITLETTETTLLRDDDVTSVSNGVKINSCRMNGNANLDATTSPVYYHDHQRGDSISNSSLQMLEDDSYSPAELSCIMAELNDNRRWIDVNRYL